MKYIHDLEDNQVSRITQLNISNTQLTNDSNNIQDLLKIESKLQTLSHNILYKNLHLIDHNYARKQKNHISCRDNNIIYRQNQELNERGNNINIDLYKTQPIISSTNTIEKTQFTSDIERHENINNLPQLQHNNITNIVPIYNEIETDYLGPMNVKCKHCNALHFKDEMVAGKGKSFNTCCNHGKVKIDDIKYPNYLTNLFINNDTNSNAFLNNIRRYNSNFAFASLNTNVVNFNNNRPGPFCFKSLGDVYYKIITSLHANENTTPTNGQVFIYDGEEAVNYRKARDNTLKKDILQNLQTMFKEHNIHAQSYLMMQEELDLQKEISAANNTNDTVPELRMVFTIRDNLDPNRYNIQRANEVAAIFTTNADGEIPESWVVIRDSHDRQLKNVPLSDKNVDAWLYPIFFPFGTGTWHSKIPKINIERNTREKYVTRNKWLKYMIAFREESSNIFLRGRRLFQQFLVTSYVNIQKEFLNWCRYNQKTLKADSYTGLKEYLQNRDQNHNKQVGKMIILPSSFVGSPRYMQQLYQDAMAEVRNSGVPHLFITQTCNPNWKEMRENLFEGQQPNDRPDLIARVFRLKKKDYSRRSLQKNFSVVSYHIFGSSNFKNEAFLICIY